MSVTYDRSEHIIGYAKQIAYSDDGTTWLPVFGTTDVTLPEGELGKSEVTNDSTPDYTKDYIPALYEPGEASFKYRYTSSMYAALEEVFQRASDSATRATATVHWKVTLPDSTTCTFKGFMTKHPLPLELENGPEVEVPIQCVTKRTYSVGS